MAQPLSIRAALSAALITLAGAALAQATTGNTKPADNNAARNLPGNADTASSPETAPAKPDASTVGGGGGTLAGGDRKFVETAAMHGLAEVEMGKLAQQKASSPEVKDFGARMVQDHGKANDELKALASAKGVRLPASIDSAHQRKIERMQKLSGAAFDRAYMKEMLSDHKKDVSEFRKQAKSAKDPDVKAFASRTLPTLEEHLHLAQRTDKEVKTAKR